MKLKNVIEHVDDVSDFLEVLNQALWGPDQAEPEPNEAERDQIDSEELSD
ncbi:MAG: hypothetical protein KZQ59_09325 [Candidatus Thiodiazotropha sp. (ex Lucinoma aequizonata)]|nr:hypothetical protein [Candidatus Thiodiazotropha sp. (ex Lucinoma aequizonata)]MCU7907559.1 hypothetical protein [Candidatus Thiodiazotropha sp. (ex Lucinoma aequizonata)]MCU7911605.1 hypothetical protein [Candidatus Thiodiazotropha sp. (ex Lucinoma aequizonata)]